MKTQVFVYREYLCISSHPSTEGLINAAGLGIVMNISGLEISQEAIDVLKAAPKEGGSYAPIQVFSAGEQGVIFGWEGGYKNVFKVKDVKLGRDDNASLLTPSEVQIPDDFKEFIHGLNN